MHFIKESTLQLWKDNVSSIKSTFLLTCVRRHIVHRTSPQHQVSKFYTCCFPSLALHSNNIPSKKKNAKHLGFVSISFNYVTVLIPSQIKPSQCYWSWLWNIHYFLRVISIDPLSLMPLFLLMSIRWELPMWQHLVDQKVIIYHMIIMRQNVFFKFLRHVVNIQIHHWRFWCWWWFHLFGLALSCLPLPFLPIYSVKLVFCCFL